MKTPLLQKQLEKFDEKFPAARNGDYTEHPRPEIGAFIISCFTEWQEEAIRRIEEGKKIDRWNDDSNWSHKVEDMKNDMINEAKQDDIEIIKNL